MSEQWGVGTIRNRTRACGFIQSESMWARTRDRIVVRAGQPAVIPAGMLMGMVLATGFYLPSPKVASDGTQQACAIAAFDIDATGDEDVIAAVVARAAEVREEDLTYHASVVSLADKQAKWAQLAAVEIMVRHLSFAEQEQS